MKLHSPIVPILLALLLLAALPVVAGKPRAYLLGGGSTNMSGNQWRIDHNGLRSGSFGYVHNLFGVYADGSYSALFSTVPNTAYQPGGYGVGGGVCYEHQRGMFKLQIGFGMRYQDVSNRVSDTTFFNADVSDALGYKYTLRYDFRDRVDRCTNVHAQVPVLLGMGVHGFYFLTGVKVNCAFRGTSSVSALGTTSGTYNQFLGQMYEMDNHGFRKDVEIHRSGNKLDFKTDVLFSFETGYEWGDEMKRGVRYRRKVSVPDFAEYRLRIAAFVDYGLPNICPQTDQNFLYIPDQYKWDFSQYEMNHVFSSSYAQPYKVHNFYAGIKVTVLIGFYVYKRCILCSDFKSEADM